VDTLEKLAEKLKTTQASTATELLAQANKLRLELAALPPPEPKPPPPPEVVLPRHLAKLRRLRHHVERQQKALDKAAAARDEAQAALDKQAERLASATKKLEEAEQTRLELLKALPTSGSPDETARRGHSAPGTPLAGTPNSLPEVVRFLGELLLPSDDDEATRMARLGGLADTLRKGLASRYADPAAMAAVLLGTVAPPPPPPEGGDDPMVTADEKETPHAGGTARLPEAKRRRGTAPRDTSGSDADEETAAGTGNETAPGTRRRSRTPPPPGNGRKSRHGPHSPATPSD
jgi:hypothetical protein